MWCVEYLTYPLLTGIEERNPIMAPFYGGMTYLDIHKMWHGTLCKTTDSCFQSVDSFLNLLFKLKFIIKETPGL